MTLKQKVSTAYELLQRMQITALKANVDAVSFTLVTLQEVMQAIPEEKKDGGKADGAD